jgi:hypothetical protein
VLSQSWLIVEADAIGAAMIAAAAAPAAKAGAINANLFFMIILL